MANVRSAVVLVFDRLRAGFLGPYGGTWCETPATNRLAAQGYLAEHAWSDSPTLDAVYRSYWSGRHAACRSLAEEGDLSAVVPAGMALADRLATAGRHAELWTDDPQVASHRWGEAFGERMVLSVDEPVATADSAGAMRVAQMLAQVAERLDSLPEGGLLWMHAAAWDESWDAPWAFRAELADEEDPEPPEFAVPPQKTAGSGELDPDELLGYVQAYAGQVAAWDACLEAWMAAFESSRLADDALLVVTSPRGYPLGEHGVVGGEGAGLFGELLQVPFFLRHPGASWPLIRDQRLWQPPDLYATLVDWFELPRRTEEGWGESILPRARGELSSAATWAAAIGALGDKRFAVRTPHWLLHANEPTSAGYTESTTSDQSDATFEPTGLYLKPDDRWEANEVSARCQETVESLVERLPAFRRALDASTRSTAPTGE